MNLVGCTLLLLAALAGTTCGSILPAKSEKIQDGDDRNEDRSGDKNLVIGEEGDGAKQDEFVRFSSVPPAGVAARQTGRAELVCSASGSPAPTVAWYRGDKLMSSHDLVATDKNDGDHHKKYTMGESVARLSLGCLTAEDAGVYTCRAVAGGHAIEAETKLTVEEYPSVGCSDRTEHAPVVARHSAVIMVNIGDTARLTCRHQTSSGVTTRWTGPDGGPVRRGGRRRHLAASGDLVIKRVGWTDMGQYTCTVENQFGKDSVTTFLYPVAPT